MRLRIAIGKWTRAAAAGVGCTKFARAELNDEWMRVMPSISWATGTAPFRAIAGEANLLNLTPMRAPLPVFETACGRRHRPHLLLYYFIITMEPKLKETAGQAEWLLDIVIVRTFTKSVLDTIVTIATNTKVRRACGIVIMEAIILCVILCIVWL